MSGVVKWLIILGLSVTFVSWIVFPGILNGPGLLVLYNARPEPGQFEKIWRNATPGDIAFGGDLKKLTAVAERLRNNAASRDEAALYNKTLHVAVVYGLPEPAQSNVSSKVVIDLDGAGDAAALIISAGPVMWRVEHASKDQRAKIGIEGPSAFDIENGPPHILAGFRSGAFGVEDSTSPRDYLEDAGDQRKSRLCSALNHWLKLFDTPPQRVRFFVFNQPTRISVKESGLSGDPPPRSGFTWTVANECSAYLGR